MRFLANVRIGTKLAVGFGTLGLLLAVVGAVGITTANRVNGLLTDLYATHATPALQLKEANILLIRISRAVRNAILDEDPAAVQKRIADIARYDL